MDEQLPPLYVATTGGAVPQVVTLQPSHRWRQLDPAWRPAAPMRDDRKYVINLYWRGGGGFRRGEREWSWRAPCAILRRPHEATAARFEVGVVHESWFVIHGPTADLLVAGGQIQEERPVVPLADVATVRQRLAALGRVMADAAAVRRWPEVLARLQLVGAAIWSRADEQGEDRDLELIRRALRREPERAWRLVDLAALCGCRPDALRQRFRRHHGCGPCDVVQRERMVLAREWLVEEPIKRVARRLGYQDQRSFGRRFKQHHGIGPRAYQRLLTP